MCTSYHVFPEENIEMRGIISELMENFPEQPVKTGRISPTDCAAAIDAQGIKPMRFGLQLPYRRGLQLNARSETAAKARCSLLCCYPIAPLYQPMHFTSGPPKRKRICSVRQMEASSTWLHCTP